VFSNNSSSDGGVSIFGGSPTFVECSFDSNYAWDFDSGAVEANAGAFIECDFFANSAHWTGGAVVCSGTTFESCTFHGNVAGWAGGAAVASGSVFRNCLFYENYAGQLLFDPDFLMEGGGALFVDGTDAVVVPECTFWNNQAGGPSRVADSVGGRESGAVGALGPGSFLAVDTGASAVLDHVIAYANTSAEATHCEPGGTIAITCSNIAGHAEGD
jgi:hypothetical protein